MGDRTWTSGVGANPRTASRTVFEPQFLALLENLPAAAYTCDRDGLITYFNPHAAEIWGREPRLNDREDRFCGSFKLYSADGATIAHDQCWMALALETGREYNGREILIERPDGRRVTVLAHANPIHDESGALLGAVNVLVDITNRERLERYRAVELTITQILAQSRTIAEAAQRILQTTCEHLGWNLGGLWAVDPSTNTLRCVDLWHLPSSDVSEFERASRGLAFVSGQGLPGRVWATRGPAWIQDVVTDGNFPRVAIAARAGLHGAFGSPIMLRGEVLGVLEFFSEEIREPDPDLLKTMLSVGSQVGQFFERIRAEHELTESGKRKDEFLALLAHELRNPLAPIRCALQILHLKTSQLPELQGSMDVIDRQIRQLTRLIDDLLDVGRITGNKLALRRERIALRDVLMVAEETSRPLIEAGGQEFEIDSPIEDIELDGDLTRLGQVVSNLLNNAAKYTPRGGRIRLSAERRGGEAVIKVWDSGIGIPAEMLPRIFDLFTQANRSPDRSQEGLGIGLSLVKHLIELHGGAITARSEGPGKGSEFIVRLPVAGGREETKSEPAAEPARAARATSLKVLVVDDNPDSVSTLAMLLSLLGSEVRTAVDGVEALRVADEFRPDAVLLDLGLPRMNGYDVAREIRRQPWSGGVALIATTGWGQESDRRLAREAGFDHHLVKPIDPDVLTRTLASLQPAARQAGNAGLSNH